MTACPYIHLRVQSSYSLTEGSLKIKKIVQNYYGINKNFILISKVKQFTNLNSLKEMVKLN